MIEALQYEFMRNALAAGILVSILCGVIGTLIVVNRMVFISGGIAHAAYGGIGIALFLGLPPLLGAGLFAVAVSVVIGVLTLKNRHRTDSIIGALWAAGMATGIIFTDLTPGYNVDLMSFLFGSILTVPTADLVMLVILDIVTVAGVMYLYHDLVALSYDGEFASLQGVPVRILYFALLAFASITIVMTIRLVGLILVIALLTIPTYLAEERARSLGRMMLVSSLYSMLFVVAGLWLSFSFNITSGASIIMVAAGVFFLRLMAGMVFGKK